jgi:hypothetical protein
VSGRNASSKAISSTEEADLTASKTSSTRTQLTTAAPERRKFSAFGDDSDDDKDGKGEGEDMCSLDFLA